MVHVLFVIFGMLLEHITIQAGSVSCIETSSRTAHFGGWLLMVVMLKKPVHRGPRCYNGASIGQGTTTRSIHRSPTTIETGGRVGRISLTVR
uniref:Putative secreted protein n=1 Tax=Anopheles triannulatus TaxID=58253 RepID=A0A2M4B3R8_9DIPT